MGIPTTVVGKCSGSVGGPPIWKRVVGKRVVGKCWGTTNTVYGTTNTDAGVGIGLFRGFKNLKKRP